MFFLTMNEIRYFHNKSVYFSMSTKLNRQFRMERKKLNNKKFITHIYVHVLVFPWKFQRMNYFKIHYQTSHIKYRTLENAPHSTHQKKTEIDLYCGHCIQKVIKVFYLEIKTWKIQWNRKSKYREKSSINSICYSKNQYAVSHNHINERNPTYGMQSWRVC